MCLTAGPGSPGIHTALRTATGSDGTTAEMALSYLMYNIIPRGNVHFAGQERYGGGCFL